ncbi:recombination directionality factor [Streptomyces turgidiscabies]|uniref:recombination directionality factor n=1 Tax=Streptomyces turgidiscabies TaxID=85558 RepID=UPI0038F759D9
MGSRILTSKKQAAELGRIRTGYSRPNPKHPKGRPIPVRSRTFLLSSHSQQYIERAAELYGGTVEQWTPQGQSVAQWRVITEASELRAILPAGDPLSQSYELWSGGGCSRRCDGVTEQLTRRPCLCRAEYGEEWHLQNEVEPGSVCKTTSRIGVMLPDMPDLGVWRLETHSHYAADVMAGGVDTVLQATEGKSMMPVRMWIEQRNVMRPTGPKHFPVVMLVPSIPALRHALSGPLSTAAALDPSTLNRPALEAGSDERPDYLAEARGCSTAAAVIAVWHRARAAGHGSDELLADLKQIAEDVEAGVDPRTGVVDDDQDDGEPGPDADGVYDVEVLGEGDDEPPTAYPAAAWPEAAHPGGGAR